MKRITYSGICESLLGRVPILLVAFLSVMGCGREQASVVDFERVVQAEKPSPASRGPVLKVAVAAMISPKETFTSYRDLLSYIGRKIGRETEFIQRKTYREVDELLGMGRIDIGFICSGPYAAGREKYKMDLLAVPEVQGAHDYKCYLIVKDDGIRTLEDLKGRVFAFTDPESNTGNLVPSYWLSMIQERPDSFFGKILYTHSHDNSIKAVSRGLVDGASVNSLIWDHYHRTDPAFTSTTRVIRQSQPYPIPPVVASRHLSQEVKDEVRRLLLSMHLEPQGRAILDQMGFDRFNMPANDWYEKLARIDRMISALGEKRHGIEKP